ncbi:MAG: phosphoribosylanthranilate isomerase [Ignavibacteriaceae bacterium]|nr:phosphoribosylanthranilate isomerase [Ignavibacteriaceae bacterium]
MKIKVCGITNLEDALLCESLGAGALGFIFYKGSKRYIEPEAAAGIINSLSPFMVKVGVFVNENTNTINQIASSIKLNAVQLHGDESPEAIKYISLPAIKSFRVDDNFDYEILKQYPGTYYLLDTYSKSGYGGTGKVFNWENIPGEYKRKIILAGGVSIDNIEEVYTKIQPPAIDLSSSLESVPGKKDKEKVIGFFKKINELKGKTC